MGPIVGPHSLKMKSAKTENLESSRLPERNRISPTMIASGTIILALPFVMMEHVRTSSKIHVRENMLSGMLLFNSAQALVLENQLPTQSSLGSCEHPRMPILTGI